MVHAVAVVAPVGKGHWTLDVPKSIETEKDVLTFNSERPGHRVGEGELSEAASNEPVSLSLSVWWWLVGEAAAAGYCDSSKETQH